MSAHSAGSGAFWAGLTALALSLLLAACASTPRPGGDVSAPSADPRAPLDEAEFFEGIQGQLSPDQAQDVTLYALGLVGTPYRWGGNTPESGFDCSGLIRHVYRSRAALTPPRTTAELTFWGRSVPAELLRSGDVVLFGRGSVANHAGIYVGNGRFVHAPSTGGTVRVDSLNSRYWQAQAPRFRRP
ncbi:MAG: C40 family peptidase [Rhodoferax sp.]